MDPKMIGVFIIFLLFSFPIKARYLTVKKRDWIGDSPPNIKEGDVECFSEYMELWIHRMRIEGLRLWLSGTLRIPVSLVSLDQLNLQLSICGYSLRRDTERNYVFRVKYRGCFVQLEHNNYVIVLNLSKRISRFGGRTSSFVMKCPVAIAPPSGEHIYCDPNFMEVTRKIPLDSWNNKLQWSLALRGKLVVALEDASVVNLSVEINDTDITVQGRRDVMTLETVLGKSEEFLPLKLVSGNYEYSMEASCPRVSSSPSGETVLHIFKRRMGLTKRGAERETLSVSDVSLSPSTSFSVSESTDFVLITLPTAHIMQTKNCTGPAGGALLQPFFSLSVMLTFNETPHKVNWSMENVFPCGASLGPSPGVTQTQEVPSSALHSPQTSASVSAVHSMVQPALYLTPTHQKPPTEPVTVETPSASALHSPQTWSSVSAVHSTVQPALYLTPSTHQKPPTEPVTMEMANSSALHSPGPASESTTLASLATEVLPGVASQVTLENVSSVASLNPIILSSLPVANTHSTVPHVNSAGPDLRPPTQLESGHPAPEPHSVSFGTEERVWPVLSTPWAVGTLNPDREVTSDPPQSSAGLHGDSLSAWPTESMSPEDDGIFSVSPSDAGRMENGTTEQQNSSSPNYSESGQDSFLEMHNHTGEHSYQAGESRLTQIPGTPLTTTPPTDTDRDANTALSASPPPPAPPPPAHPSPSASGAQGGASTMAGGGCDSEQTHSVVGPLPAASGQTLPLHALASGSLNTWQSTASANSSASEWSSPGPEGQITDVSMTA